MMKAALYERYGSADVLDVREVERPAIKDDEILVEVHAASVTTADWRLRASAFPGAFWLPGRLMFGLFAPRRTILGSDFAGRVARVGKNVTQFKRGDAVFGFAGHGAHAEYLAIREDGVVVQKPEQLGFDEAAAVPFGALSALVFLRDFAKLRPGQKVLINGASGGVGVYAVQLAKHFGAEVTGVSSAANLDLVRSLGADHAIDYAAEDVLSGGRSYNVILDTVGKIRFDEARRALQPNGVIIPLEFGGREILQSLAGSVRRGPKLVIGVSGDRKEDLAFIAGLLEKGEIRPVIDSRYPLERIADAHRKVESRHKRGSVIVTVGQAAAASVAAEQLRR